ncbi:hypothetical protein DCAR_0624380 [Daucus carota subsp. sativus]|uniref:Uncharacterized protein n=1 Tax=Daucus carota subsp. sativus TaxID=79200 RepID=A0A164VT14_DAUCS|nr:hypothetical protein DCAR_0624380 [Daucus carota subsp. sativus]
MRKNKSRRLATEQDVDAALQLIQLKDYSKDIFATKSDQHLACGIRQPFTKIVLKPKETPQAREKNHDDEFMKIVLKSKEFLEARDINHYNDNDDDDGIKKRKSGGVEPCSSSITFDLDDGSDEDVNQGVGSVKKTKTKKFRSIVDVYNVTEPL